MNGSDRPGDFGVVHDGSGKTSKVALGLHLVPSLRVVGNLLGEPNQTERTIGHETKNILRLAEYLGGLGTIDGVEVRIVFQAMLAGGRQHDGHALDGCGISYGSALPLGDPVRAKVHFEFAPVVGRNIVSPRTHTRFFRIVFRLEIDQLVEPCDVFLRRDAPNTRRRRSGR